MTADNPYDNCLKRNSETSAATDVNTNFDNIDANSGQSRLIRQAQPLFSSEQVYEIEKAWFDSGYDSFALMQQAAWIMSQYIHHQASAADLLSQPVLNAAVHSATVWVGAGNNGGDGWLIALYLSQLGWQIRIVDVGQINPNDSNDAARAKELTLKQAVTGIEGVKDIKQIKVIEFADYADPQHFLAQATLNQSHYHIDALFGIGLDRAPKGKFAKAIDAFNAVSKDSAGLAIAVDIPSGVVSSTGQVFAGCAIKADMTLCLVATKIGLMIKDGPDYGGQVVQLPLIPYLNHPKPIAWRLTQPYRISPRKSNSHKGSFGHVLIIGGNQSLGSQGMGGAAIMSAGSALVGGAGKLTAACHPAFHGALIAAQPNAMVVDIGDIESVIGLIGSADVIAIGMGLGRDDQAAQWFARYLSEAIDQGKSIVIDADGLYHLADLQQSQHSLITRLFTHANTHEVCFTPHSGEAAKLLGTSADEIEADRVAAIRRCADIYGGQWLLKGTGSIVLIEGDCFVCSVGNAGMATAGMGDVLAGLIAALLAQVDIAGSMPALLQAVLIHGYAGDLCVQQGQGLRSLQAPDMLAAMAQVMAKFSQTNT